MYILLIDRLSIAGQLGKQIATFSATKAKRRKPPFEVALNFLDFQVFMAEPTGLEPATSEQPDAVYLLSCQLFTASRNSDFSASAGFLTGRKR